MSIALACLLVISASLVSGALEQRREQRRQPRAVQSRGRNLREPIDVRVTIEPSEIDPLSPRISR